MKKSYLFMWFCGWFARLRHRVVGALLFVGVSAYELALMTHGIVPADYVISAIAVTMLSYEALMMLIAIAVTSGDTPLPERLQKKILDKYFPEWCIEDEKECA